MKTEEFKYPGEPSDEEFLREIDAENRAFMAEMTSLSPETLRLVSRGREVTESGVPFLRTARIGAGGDVAASRRPMSPLDRIALAQFNQASDLTERIAAASAELKTTDSISRKTDLGNQIDKLRTQIADLKGPYGKQELEKARLASVAAKKKLWRSGYEEEEAQRRAAQRALDEKIDRRAKVIQETAPMRTQYKSDTKTTANPGSYLP